jgi:hypothetical protein
VHILGRTTSAKVGRAPTLEEVVLGYLAEARTLARSDVDREAAA